MRLPAADQAVTIDASLVVSGFRRTVIRGVLLQQDDRFRPRLAGVAQLVEQLIRNQQVVGSSPTAGSIQKRINNLR